MTTNVVVITGASSGIGLEFVRRIDTHFSNVDEIWLIARSRSRLQELAAAGRHKMRVLAMDLTKEAQLDRLEDMLEEKRAKIRLLVHCAGYGLTGKFSELPLEGQLGMVRLNCEALTHLTYRCLPYMCRNSRMIQLASAAAFLPQPGFAVYGATKSYVLSFSRALGEELRGRGIYVTGVCPGPVDTPFFDIAGKIGTDTALRKIAYMKKLSLVTAEVVVTKALRDSYLKRPVSVVGLPMQIFQILAKYLPHQWLLQAMTDAS
ncbi:MAG: SDR family NAD(P)-dependent oxidoreductase [Clostridium sp.]|nr:SDR family NAD(P)-dependent oxidoreductase [Clostridium sp.]